MTSQTKQNGFTIVEVMVAITIGLILLAGVSQLFLSSKSAYRTQNAMARIQEDGRFAVSFLSRDIREADFWACGGGANLDLFNNLNSSGTGYIDFEKAITGSEGGIGTDGDDPLPDSLTLHSSDSADSSYAVEWHNQMSATVHLDTAAGLSQGDIVAVCDPTSGGGDIFQITNNPPQSGNSAGNIVHNTGNNLDPGNSSPTNNCPNAGQGSTHCLKHQYDSSAILMKTRTSSYSIADTGRTDSYGDAIYALYINGVEVVENVDDFQILYGRDTDNDGLPERYENASHFADANPDVEKENWKEVVAVKFALLLKSQDQVRDTSTAQTFDLMDEHQLQFDDRRLRQVFTSTVKIRNRGVM